MARRNLRFAATALVVAAGVSLLASASDTASASSTAPASARTYIYRLDIGLIGYADRCCPSHWTVYNEGGELVCKARRGNRYRQRWNVGGGGYAEPSSGGRWNVWGIGRVRTGYVKRGYGNRWNVFSWSQYSGYIREGYAQGPGGVVGGAALLLCY